MAGLAKFGASSFEYGVIDPKTGLITATRKVPGLSEVKIDITNDLKTLAADDSPYLVLSGGITEATEEISIYDIDSQMKQDLFGIQVINGVEVYPKTLTPNDIATLFRTKLSNGKFVWVGMLSGKFSIPSMDQKTVDGTPDPDADDVKGSFVARGDADTGNVMLIGREDNTGFDFATFHKYVFPAKTGDDTIAPVTTPPANGGTSKAPTTPPAG